MSRELKDLSLKVVEGGLSRRDFMGRAAALGVAAPLASQLLSGTAMANPQRGGHFIIGNQGGSSTDSLDPAAWASQVPLNFGRNWGETLVYTDPNDGSAQPLLAESWEASSDAKTWSFKIRKGVTFHNGKEMTIDDVVASLKRHSDESSESGALGIMKTVGSNFRADGDNLLVELDAGNADLPFLLSDYHLVIQPNGGVDEPGAGIGTGPYKIEVNEPGVRHVATRIDGHWNDGNVGWYDSVEVLVINDTTARVAALTSGKCHVINRVDPKTVDLLKRAPNLSINNISGRGHYVFISHIDTAPFDNNDLRLALKYAVNREELVDKILRGYGSVGNDFPINGAYALFPEEIPQREFDLDKAAFHYKESGHDGSPIVLRTSNAAFGGAEDAAVLFQQTCNTAGIPLQVKREPQDGYWSNVWNVQPFSVSYWGGRPTQDQMYSVAYYSSADWNDTRWKVPAFDKMLLEARAELDLTRRKEIYTDMGLMLRDEGGLILPMFNDFIDASVNKVQGQLTDPAGGMSNGFIGLRTWFA
ncbi:MAG: ABC transporter substrate-binding protein [Paracoccaceae bacterium]|nr:ABC transporter substrate-binding protein [Paracoccaceae bacterium]